jgi:hypothetical protein
VQAVNPPPDGGYPGNNTAEGTSALFSLTTGIANTALGSQALYYNTTGDYNTAEGFRALFSNTSGAQNTAYGSSALTRNTTGFGNTANGVNTLYRNTAAATAPPAAHVRCLTTLPVAKTRPMVRKRSIAIQRDSSIRPMA